jgi:pilus assembly protein Flp/PilA
MLFSPKEKGQGLVEYALILVLVAVVVIAALTLLGPTIRDIFTSINTGLTS